jgi:hypothetical protein
MSFSFLESCTEVMEGGWDSVMGELEEQEVGEVR